MPKHAPDYAGIAAWAKAHCTPQPQEVTEMANPITPDEAAAHKAAVLPEGVIEEFNDLIALAFDGRTATVMQDDVAEAVAGRLGISVNEVFDRHLLDVEPVYRAAGWEVQYDKPGFNESYRPYFKFSRP